MMSKKLFWPECPTEYNGYVSMQNFSQYGKVSDFEIQRETIFGKTWLPLTYGTMVEDTDVIRTGSRRAEKELKGLLNESI